MSKNIEEIKDSKVALVAHIVTSLIYLALGICLLTLDTGLIGRMVYSSSVLAAGILFICFGGWYMIKYFFNHEYTKISHYGFTMGVILVIIGSIFIFKADNISVFIDSLVGLIGIVLGAVMLQQSFALFHIQRGSWVVSLIFGFATIGVSIYFFLTPFKFFEGSMISCIYLIAVGTLSLLSLLLMAIGLRDHRNDSNRLYNRNIDDSPNSQEDFFEDEPQGNYHDSSADVGSDSLFED